MNRIVVVGLLVSQRLFVPLQQRRICMIKYIVFDFGGVLVDYNFKNFFAHLLGSEEKATWFLNNVFTEEMNNKLDMQLKPFGEYIEEWKTRWPEYAHELDYFDLHYTDIFTGEVAGMKVLMEKLKAQGYQLLGLSNWSSKVNDVMKKFPDCFRLLDGYLVSYMVHQLKPAPEIYQSFIQKFGIKADECVFIDDKPKNIEGAKNIGMKGIVFKDAQQLERDLMSILQ